MAKKTEALAKATPTSLGRPLEDWEKEAMAQASGEKAQGSLGVARITHQSGVIKVDDKPVEGNRIKLAIVDMVKEKSWFSKPYEAGTSATPDCYSFARPLPGEKAGETEARMVPHEAAPDKQNPDCRTCKFNVFGSGRGRAKACGDRIRLLVISPRIGPDGKPSVGEDDVDRAELRQLSIPPASLGAFSLFYASLGDRTRTGNLREAIVEVSTGPLPKGGHGLKFDFAGTVPTPSFKKIMELSKKKADALITPYPVIEAEAVEQTAQKQARGKKLR